MTSKRFFTIALCLATLFAFAAGAGAQELGARAFGMGGAYVALSDDIGSLVYNPAGLPSFSFQVGIGLGSSDLSSINQFQSLLDDPSSFSGDAGLDIATLSGISIGSFGLGIAAHGNLSVSESGDELTAKGEYMNQVILGYGRHLGIPGLRAGVSVKRLDTRSIVYEKGAPAGGTYLVTADDWTGEGYSVSVGAQLKASNIFTIGVSASDIASSLTWTGKRTVSEYDEGDDSLIGETPSSLGEKVERLEPLYRFGVAITPPILGVTLAGDLGSDGSVRYGVEKGLLLGLVKLRAGGIRVSDVTTTTAGIGIHLGPVRIDAAAGSSDGFKTFSTMIEGSVRF